MAKILQCALGPKLFRIHGNREEPSLGPTGRPYLPPSLESRLDSFLGFISTAKNIVYYTCPLWMTMLYRRGGFTITFGTEVLKYSAWLTILYIGLLFARGFARSKNQTYIDFLTVLEQSKAGTGDIKHKRKYDFSFSHWPVDYTFDKEGQEDLDSPPYHFTGRLHKLLQNRSFARLLVNGLPCEVVSYALSHGFGLSMVYPGSTALLSTLVGPALLEGRNKLVEQLRGKRSKLLSANGDSIDTMFVDGHKKEMEGADTNSERADTLVICCEGNAGFYEVGCMVTAMEAGYSVLGWNHPGFGGSTGTPCPSAEIDAINVVMQYAVRRLGFEERNIAVFAWSIGAFSAIQAAKLYPNIKFLFLDATFDDVLPLAQKAMPQAFAGYSRSRWEFKCDDQVAHLSIEGIVKNTIRSYINLNNGEAIKDYNGPVHFMRREMDEVMNQDGQRIVSSNCGNALLYKFLRHRFPLLVGDTSDEAFEIKAALDTWLSKDNDPSRASVLESFEVDEEKCEKILHTYIASTSAEYPSNIGSNLTMQEKQQVLLYLAVKHMSFFESSHCPPLPSSMFGMPWDIHSSLPNQFSTDSSSEDFEIIKESDE